MTTIQPKRSRWRRDLKRIVISALVVVLGLTLLLAFTAGIHTEPFRDANGKVIPNSVAIMEKFEIGGIKQMLWFRSVDTDKLVLILLHSGPGFSESAFFVTTTASWSSIFWWCTGISAALGAPFIQVFHLAL